MSASNVGCIPRCPGRLQSVTKQYKEHFLTRGRSTARPRMHFLIIPAPTIDTETWPGHHWPLEDPGTEELRRARGWSRPILVITGPGHPALAARWWHWTGPDVRTGLSLSLLKTRLCKLCWAPGHGIMKKGRKTSRKWCPATTFLFYCKGELQKKCSPKRIRKSPAPIV